MLRLSVVHAPVGPQEGPGLDDDIQSTDKEDSAMYTGPQKDESFGTGGGDDSSNDVKNPGSDDSPWHGVSAMNLPRSVVGIDFDGTVTADPRFFSRLVAGLHEKGCKAYLITGRPYTERDNVESYCKRYALEFDAYYFYPFPYRHTSDGVDAILELKIGSWKADVLSSIKANLMIEDSDVFISQIVSRLPRITVMKPVGG